MQTELYPERIARPTSRAKEIVKIAAEAYAERMHGRWSDWSVEEWAEALIEHHSPFKDGYELAKDLERDGFDPDAEMVSELDGFESEVSSVHRKAVKDWVKLVGFEPLYQVGDDVLVPRVLDDKGGRGRISEILLESAEYLVKTDPDSSSAYVIKAEDITGKS
ncbi:hypothetical protein [uncultured Salinicola sp.]|uniref:hypothetical protein n=1 Tax=uncultured Salinicola sp. TaxID=1193542 RepID=UPI0026227DD7|nr:hypothetical protein [uncultured Salinicola sp.]|tara:strand:- start:221 stop:709 length:489 start_codon:yes stop_codon:yes gene_type:complete